MKDWQQRVIDEKADLDAKLGKLVIFMDTKAFDALPLEEKERLHRQELLMELYSDVLGERIRNFVS